MVGELVQVEQPADAAAATATPGPDAGLRMVGGPGRFRRILGKPIQAQPMRTPPMTLMDLETAHVRDILSTHGGNRRAAAEALQISERTLYRKLRRYGLS